MQAPRVIVVMGVSGSGKTTIGSLLAARNGGSFHDADDFHSTANIAKMAAGHPLDDADRAPWLARLKAEVIDPAPAGRLVVLACSALKKRYRDALGVGADGIALVHLEGGKSLLTDRLDLRGHHYMKTGMLGSQLEALEPPGPDENVTVGIDGTPEEIVESIESAFGLGK